MRNLTELTPLENSNMYRDKASLTPFEVFEIEQVQGRIIDTEIPLENYYNEWD